MTFTFFFNIQNIKSNCQFFFQIFSNAQFLMDNFILPCYNYFWIVSIQNSLQVFFNFMKIQLNCCCMQKNIYIIIILRVFCCRFFLSYPVWRINVWNIALEIYFMTSLSLREVKLIVIVNWNFHESDICKSIMISFKYGLILLRYFLIDRFLSLSPLLSSSM